MHVLLTIASLDHRGGGTSQTVAQTARHLAEMECTVTILTFASDRASVPVPSSSSLTVQRVETGPKPWHLWGNLKRFRTRLRRCLQAAPSETVLHDNGLWLPVNHVVAREAQRAEIPRVVSTHGMLEPWSVQHKALRKRVAWWLYQRRDLRRAEVLHATADAEARTLRSAGLDNPIVVAPNGVDLPPSPNEEVPDSDGPRVCLFLSRIHEVKGLPNLVEAWARLHPDKWKVVVAGPDEDGHEQEVRERVRAQGLTARFEFVGPVEGKEKKDLFRRADTFVLPTHSENFGIVVAEALSYGVPVITTKGAPWQDLVEHECGWWVEVGVEPLVAALEEATQLSPAERRAMGERGRELVRQKYTWSQVASTLAATYKWTLGRQKRPDAVRS
ncbi:glycosyltransferase [Salinibacter altiplanensis]|uniref:glycosyltransferase n=1 Tax=Salinibacter altiplanensis TaxID=1803181 RepID=UPI000C9FCEB5|nr:glycosyltransferase [Salinibacter altiplanensis]